MPNSIKWKLEKLQADYIKVFGKSFNHFYCPILFKDEETELCKAHIINRAFPNSARDWTIQRKDVDNFYGAMFESDFLDIRKFSKDNTFEIFGDKTLSKRFNAKIYVDEKPVDHFFSSHDIPQQFTSIQFEGNESTVGLGLKMCPKDVVSAKDKNWEIEISRNVCLPMIASTIKAAHLTLFNMLGYTYVNRLSANFIGRQVLGEFFLVNVNKPKQEVVKEARKYFLDYIHMVRPLISSGDNYQGTVKDRKLLMCVDSNGSPWAMLVFVKSAHLIHSVMIPTFDNPDHAVIFMNFLKNDHSNIQVVDCKFEQNHWEISKESRLIIWPKEEIDHQYLS